MTSTATNNTPTASPAMDAWTMATSILTGLRKASVRAQEEHEAALSACGQSPFGPGVMPARLIVDAIGRAGSRLEVDLNLIARANRLPMPSSDAWRSAP